MPRQCADCCAHSLLHLPPSEAWGVWPMGLRKGRWAARCARPFPGPGPVMTQLVHSHGPVAETAAVLRSPNPPFIQVLPFSVLRARGVSTVKPSPNTHILPASASLWSFKSVSQVFLYLVPQPALSVSPLSAGPVRRCCRAALWREFACSGAFVKHAEVWPLTTSL